jgi:hypothetical protein
MDNLLLLCNVATRPVKRRKPNPRCSKPGHSSTHRASIQRHTCSSCFKERAAFLFANPNLTRWDVACILTREFRNYFCCCCVLEGRERIQLTKYCRNGHQAVCQEHRCQAHNLRLTECLQCPDPRAGTSYHPCGKHRMGCACSCGPFSILGEHPQDPQTVALKTSFTEAMLQRTRV